ncbi:tripartite motif-containing protein 54-like [Corythoichthys intestinalis]|uniref:tripartite motif-containing protein 54-like n=1 Tax=Corythoichthys intestinalis TaxID=161448 RepID=UPI0025A52566|nr:tripartite motif-containing protein 54-like [Corythoichthys intestinalis]
MSLSQLQKGGAECEADFATLEKQLMCPICTELLQKPIVILPCQHNLCRRCADALYQSQNTLMLSSGSFCCPSCHQKVVLDCHGVYGLQRNLLVENIIDIYKHEVCGHSGSRSLPLPPSLPAQVICSQHSDEKVNIYCVSCQLAICSLCKVFGEHESCQVQSLEDAMQHKKDELRESVASVVEINQKIRAIMDELDEKCRKIEETCKTHKQNVYDKFRRMSSIVEERLSAMTERISKEEEEKAGGVRLLVRCYGDSVEANRKLLEKAVSALEDPDMVDFIQNSKDLITKVKTASSFHLVEMLKPSNQKMKRYRCNFRQQESAIAAIDFITFGDPLESTQNTESPEHSEVEDVSTQVPLSQAEPTLAPPECSIQDRPIECEKEQVLMKEEAQGEAKECSASQEEMAAQINTQQAVIALFYLVAFLVLLQKAWSYIGCFIIR